MIKFERLIIRKILTSLWPLLYLDCGLIMGFDQKTFEGMQQFHSIFTEG